MKAGKIVRLRINPADCLRILDTLESAGIAVRDLSFAQCASLALSSLLLTMEKTGKIPPANPFKYIERMAPFEGGKSSQKKRQITEAYYRQAANGVEVPTLAQPPAQVTQQERERLATLHEQLEAHGTLPQLELEEYRLLERKIFG